jgi:3-keto-disaccharide hydrolase
VIVTYPVDGVLKTKKLYRFTSLKFDYMIAPAGRRIQPRAKVKAKARAKAKANARAIPHAVAELYLDQALNLGNLGPSSEIIVTLGGSNPGHVMTRRSANPRALSTQSTSSQFARPIGEWNEMEFQCGERSIQILLNGVEVNRLETPRRINAKVAFSFGGVELRIANLRIH